ncbi:MAG TPA: response regulator, partial [Desulfotignum sp.]|nr:response regulator [Desulfotignum sp.]
MNDTAAISIQNHPPIAVVVNDDATQRNILARLLQKSDITVRAFDGATAALRAMKGKPPPDLIVTDLFMPEIDGWRFCRLLRSPEYPAYHQVPILVVSATLAGEEASRITADLGANAFLSAPVDGDRFLDTAKSLLAGKQPRNQLQVLVVEDSRTLTNLLKKFFAQQGFSVTVAMSLASARDLLEEKDFDLAVIDYHLPDGKGDALLPGNEKQRPDMVRIMMTTDPGPELALKWMQQGAGAYLRKPFDPGYLLEICTRALKERAYVRMKGLLEERTRDLRESRDLLEKKSEEQRLLLDGIKTQVWYLSDGETYGRVNRAHADFLGFHPRKIAYKRLEDFLSMDVAAVCKQSNQAVFETRAPVHTEEWVPNALGEARLLEITKVPKLNEDNSVAFVVCTAADITDRKQAETRNSYQLGLITSLMNSIPDLVFYKNLDGVYLGCNHEFACHAGTTPDQVVGKTDYDLYPEKEADAFRANDKKMLDIGRPRHNEEWVSYPDGRQILLDTLKAPLRSMDGELIGSIGISRDITRRKHLEAKIRYLRKTESLGRMAGAVAHHYNNMLSVVSGYLEMAMDDLAGDAGAVNNLSAALKASQRASKMGHMMLAVLGKTEPANRLVDLSKVCREHLAELQKNTLNDVALETDLPDPGPAVKTNTKQIQQVIENLVSNALESMADLPQPVPVRVHIKTVPSDAIQSLHRYPVDFQAGANVYACLEIADQGHGIPEKDIENIFDPFYSSKFIGRGLGLSLTLAIVKA